MTETKPMRLVFGETLQNLGEEYKNLVVLDADVSSSTQTKWFGQSFPERFFNFGIAEANMVSAAAGMATCSLIPVVSTFAFLLALRTGDQVRSLISYNNLNVKLAGGYSGLSDFADGASHQAVTDLSIMTSMPNMTVIVPSDIDTTKWAVKAMLDYDGPVYLRLSRDSVSSLHNNRQDFRIGDACVIREGKDVTLAVTGTLLPYAIKAADELKKKNIDAAVVEFVTIKPIDKEILKKFAKKTKGIVTIEEHNIHGGLGSIICEELSECCPVPIKRIGLEDCFGDTGSYDTLLEKYGLTTESIIKAAQELL